MKNFSPEHAFSLLNAEISRQTYGENPPELYEPLRYLMNLGGKRLRPMLVLMGSYLFEDDYEQHLRPAIAVEVFHNFTLMHDDIMDNAPLRRGKPTVHEKWNANTAILSGDVMLVQAYQMLLDIPADQLPGVLRAFNRCAAQVCEGQQIDMNFEARSDVTETEYLEMIRLKTAVLLGFSLQLGGMVASASPENLLLLRELGENIGVGFQLKDDLLDVFGDQAKFGKQVGGDIIANKKTFLLIEALNTAKGEIQEQLWFWLSQKDFDKAEKVKAVTQLYNALHIKALTENKINEYFSRGFACLEKLQADPSKKAFLEGFIQNLRERES